MHRAHLRSRICHVHLFSQHFVLQNTSIRYLAEKSMAVMSNMMVASQSSPINQKSKNEIVDSMEHVALLALEHLKNDDETLDISTVS